MRKARRAAARRGRRLRIMFTDEARFGRMNRIRPCWAPIGTRPAVAAQLIREYIYLYGAVAPKDGTYVYLIRHFAGSRRCLQTTAAATLSFPTTSCSCISPVFA